MMSKSPAFQFYPSDFTMGTQFMTCEAIGAYMKLLCADWANDGIPNDANLLGMLCGSSEDALRSAMSKFQGCPDGLLRNERLQKERVSQAKRREKSKKANDARWNRPSTKSSPKVSSEDKPRTIQATPKSILEDSPSSSSSSSLNTITNSNSINNTNIEDIKVNQKKPKKELTPKEIEFEAFWKSFPQRPNDRSKGNKPKTRALYVKLSADNRAKADANALNYHSRGEYTLNADNWLRDGDWLNWDKPQEKPAFQQNNSDPRKNEAKSYVMPEEYKNTPNPWDHLRLPDTEVDV